MSGLNFSIKIESGKRTLVDIAEFGIAPNKITFLFGESGIGKSIISKAIYGLLDADELQIQINDNNYKDYLSSPLVNSIRRDGFFVFQEPSTHLNPLLPLSKQLNEGSLEQVNKKDEESIIRFLWGKKDTDFLKRLLQVFPKPYRPSGGEKQRILLVMAFKKIKQYIDDKTGNQTAVFIFDEPSGSLDDTLRNMFIKLLMECYKKKPFTILIITHDYSIISEIEKSYQELTAAVEYKELVRTETGVRVRDFSKDEYLGWIKKQKYISASVEGTGYPLFQMQSGLHVFGKELSFFKESKHLNKTNLVFKRGELVYLKAGSGAGKTTIAKIIMGLVKAEKLLMVFDKLSVTESTPEYFWRKNIWGKRAAMIFQHADEALNQNATVLEIFKALSKNRRVDRKKVLRRIQEMFEVEITLSFLDKQIKYLSGGQKQRINILRSFVLDTDILIMDEPLNGLDLRSADKVIEKIKQRQSTGKSILLISHNEEIFDKIVKPDNVYYLA